MTTRAEQRYMAYEQGRKARENGWERVSPYKGIKAEKYWYAGYDGTPMKEVAESA